MPARRTGTDQHDLAGMSRTARYTGLIVAHVDGVASAVVMGVGRTLVDIGATQDSAG
jgi:hypothetical protein